MRAKLREIKEQLRERMHEPIPEQGRWLKQVVTGFFAYHAVPTNSQALSAFRHYSERGYAQSKFFNRRDVSLKQSLNAW